MPSWTIRKLEEFLKPYRIEHIVQDDINYRQVTISKNHGISFRGSKIGKTIGRKRQFIIDLKTNPNTLIFTRQGVLDGAIGIAPADVDECIVTENMPMMSVNTDIIEISYLRKLLLSDYLYEKIRLLTVVGSAQKSIHERDLLNIEIKLPDIKEQKIISKKFNSLDVEHAELKTEITYQQTLIKKLRKQILQEAIEGKLTAEWRKRGEGKYEHASVLLERIIAEKNQLIKDKKIKPQKDIPPISDKDKPFPLPSGWVWCRIDDISNVGTGATPLTSDSTYYGGNINWMTSSDTKFDFVTKTKTTITEKALSETNCKIYPVGTLVVAMYGQTRGQVTELKIETATNQACANISLYIPSIDTNQFVKIHFKKVYDEIRKLAQGGAQLNLNIGKIKANIVALQPLAEQKIIVAKVTKLLDICDQLEAKITENKTHAEQLMRAVLKEAFAQK